MTARVVVFDYGSGNLRSAARALARVGADVVVTADTDAAREADGVVVPGVGAFAACMAGLVEAGGDEVVVRRVEAGRPVLGICVGMQVLFEVGEEHGVQTPGLGILQDKVTRLQASVLPHIGWNTIDVAAGSALFEGIEHERFYFAHSYAAHGGQQLVSYAEHGERFTAAVESQQVCATQFHPEKSGDTGAQLLENWLRTLS